MHQLRITAGPGAGRVLALNPAYTYSLGRDAAAHLSVPEDQTLSRTHAEFVPQAGAWLLRNKSQHGSLVNGQVVHGDMPIPVNGTFQIGAITVAFEVQGAPAAAAAPVPQQPPAMGGDPMAPTVPPAMPGQPAAANDPFAAGGAPQAGQPAAHPGQPGQPAGQPGQPVGADAAAAGKDAGKALAAGGAALAASLAEGAGPVTIDHEGPGYPFMDLVKGGLAIVKGNLIPSLALMGPLFLFMVVFILVMTVLASVLPGGVLSILSLVMSLLMLAVSLAMPQVICNYLAAVKEFQATGRRIALGDLLKFNDIVQRYITLIIVGVANCLCYVPGMVICMAIPLIVDHPEAGFMNAVKAALAFGKRNLVPNILLCIVGGVLLMVGYIALGIGVVVTYPAAICYGWLAYSLKKSEILAAAAEDGIQIG